MLIPLGILASAGAGVATDYELIATTILGANASSVTFSNLGDYASSYKNLQIRVTARATSNLGGAYIRLNGDAGANYKTHFLYGQNTSVVSGFTSLVNGIYVDNMLTANNNAANIFSAAIIDILDSYSTTKNKTLKIFNAQLAASGNVIMLHSAFRNNTEALSSITILPSDPQSILAGSRFSLYGTKG